MTQKQPPQIIAFASGKGGVGKSTSCLSIAGALAARGETVHIVDFDQTQTLWRWYSTLDADQRMPNLSVEQPPRVQDLGPYIKELWANRSGYLLIDLAGSLTDVMLLVSALAKLVIIPSKLNEPDLIEAQKLAKQIGGIAQRIGKDITHRLLINEVPSAMATFQMHVLNQIGKGSLPRFNTLLHYRAAYPESFLTGQTPHFADQKRAPIAKAVEEINLLMGEIDALLVEEHDEQREAA